ncbi:hypothetical protein JTP67_33660, partial [Streptomyces sp. S12]|nr:hypothetical protein [Streptomyces sp. S12]
YDYKNRKANHNDFVDHLDSILVAYAGIALGGEDELLDAARQAASVGDGDNGLLIASKLSPKDVRGLNPAQFRQAVADGLTS